MIKIHATKKLLTKLFVNKQVFLPPEKHAPAESSKDLGAKESLLSGWPTGPYDNWPERLRLAN